MRSRCANRRADRHAGDRAGDAPASRRVPQILRIKCSTNAAVFDGGRIARAGSRHDTRGAPRRPGRGLRRHHRRAPPPSGRLRSRTPHGDRERPRRDSVGRPPRPHDRRARLPAHSQQGLGELAEHDARRGRGTGGRDRAPIAHPWFARGRVTPIWPVRSSTTTPISAMSWSAPARARPRRASPPARSRGNSCRRSAAISPVTSPA